MCKKERLPRMILKIILRQSLFVSRPCRYRPYPKAGRTVEPQPFALGKPFLPKMPDGSRRGNWKANAPPARSGSFRSASGDICRLPYRGTVLKDVCAIQIEEIGLGGIFAIWHPLIQRGNVYASASPRLRQALRASSSGVSWQITLSQARFAPFSRQLSSQVRIHSPSPQP